MSSGIAPPYEIWTSIKADLNYRQTYHMNYQRCAVVVHWFYEFKNTYIVRRRSFPHIGNLIQKYRHALFGHVVNMNQQALLTAS